MTTNITPITPMIMAIVGVELAEVVLINECVENVGSTSIESFVGCNKVGAIFLVPTSCFPIVEDFVEVTSRVILVVGLVVSIGTVDFSKAITASKR